MMKASSMWILLIFANFNLPHAFADKAPSPEQLLQDSDRSRGAAAAGLTWSVKINTHDSDGDNDLAYGIQIRGNDALAEVTAPPRDRGAVTLFNDRVLWFYKPGIRKPISISPRQKLVGLAANGDIASTNYMRDYSGTVVGEETIDGVPTWRLELKARATNVTYDRIRYWITKSSHLGVQAYFLTVSGVTFKQAKFEYRNQLQTGAKAYPFVSKMLITDPGNAKNFTQLNYGSPRLSPLPASRFNVNNLIR